jgi:hypothetical protein
MFATAPPRCSLSWTLQLPSSHPLQRRSPPSRIPRLPQTHQCQHPPGFRHSKVERSLAGLIVSAIHFPVSSPCLAGWNLPLRRSIVFPSHLLSDSLAFWENKTPLSYLESSVKQKLRYVLKTKTNKLAGP